LLFSGCHPVTLPTWLLRRYEWWLVVAIVFLAAFLRLVALDAAPPGLWFDEAANGVDARHILEGDHQIFFADNNGREPLFIYLLAAVYSLADPSIIALRLLPAIIGILTVAAVYPLGRRLFDAQVATIATFLLATSYWHISLSRMGLRVVLLPLAEVITAYCVLRALGSRSWYWWAFAGASLGATAYTYLASRLVPIWLLVFLLASLIIPAWRAGKTVNTYLFGLVIFLVVAAVVFAPLGGYFWHHPDQFMGRASQTLTIMADLPGGDETQPAFATGVISTLGMFTFSGDMNGRHNLPGRPVFDWLQSGAFYLGVFLPFARWRQKSGWICVLWTGIMLLPGAVSSDAPHFLRTAGVIPAPMLLAALGVASATRPLERWAGSHRPRLAPFAWGIAGLSLVISAAFTTYDYFGRWAPSRTAYDAFQADLWEATKVARGSPGEVILPVSGYYRGAPMPIGGVGLDPGVLRAIDTRSCLVVPSPIGAKPSSKEQPIKSVRYITAGGGLPTRGGIGELLPALRPSQTISGPDGLPALEEYRAPAQALAFRQPDFPTSLLLGDAIHISGYDLTQRVAPSNSGELRVYWRLTQPLPQDYHWKFFAHVINQLDDRWASYYQEACPPHRLQTGDQVVSWFPLSIPSNTPVDTYRVVFGRFNESTGENMPVRDAATGREVRPAVIAKMRVTDAGTGQIGKDTSFATWEGGIGLNRYDLPARVKPGIPLDLALYWYASQPASRDYTVFAQLLGGDGQIIAQRDSQPQEGAYPTTVWGDNEIIVDQRSLLIPNNIQPQELTLIVGLYDLATGQRLPLASSNSSFVTLGKVRVE
jgi:4-amino-4-deoxy-L-arabinose transferase-like glycosyltransferase